MSENEIEDKADEDDPELQQLNEEEPEVDDEDEEVSNEKDSIDNDLQPEEYDPANDGDDSILEEVVKEEISNG